MSRLESWQWQLRVIRQHVAMNVMQTLEYRGAFFIYMFDTVVGPLISLLVWLAVSDQGVRLPFDRSQFVTYYVLLGLVSMLTGTWLARYLARAIRLGTLSPWLLRPAPYLAHQIGNNLGEKVIKLALLLPMVGLAALALRADLRLPAAPSRWALFAVSLPLAAAVAFLLDVVVGSLAFWIHDVGGPSSLLDIARSFLNGKFVPLALFPAWLGGFLEAQPFRYTLSFPLEVLIGSLGPDALARGFAWQTGYVVGLWALYKVMWRYGLRVYSASGT